MNRLQIRLFGPYFRSFSAPSYDYEPSNELKSFLKHPNFRFGPDSPTDSKEACKMMYANGMMDGWGMMNPVMWIFMLLFWGLAIFGLIFVVRWLVTLGKTRKEKQGPETPLDILKARYARGEIGKEQFEQMKKDLE
jgi:putative membrane protein